MKRFMHTVLLEPYQIMQGLSSGTWRTSPWVSQT